LVLGLVISFNLILSVQYYRCLLCTDYVAVIEGCALLYALFSRYRKWDLGNGIELVCRCEHDAATYGTNGELQMMNVKALNEWDSRVSMFR
jgi:Eukaryotic translation initiation factor 3 subunit 7 (eIF-3)